MTITAPAPRSLDDRIAEAREAEASQRQAAGKLSARYTAAVAAADHREASRLKPLLDEAQEQMLIAEGAVAALLSVQQQLAQQQAEKTRADDLAQQRARAQQILGDAIAAERLAHSQVADHITRMYACLRAARDEFGQAQDAERAVAAAQRQAIAARVTAGELAAPTRPPGANTASVLAEPGGDPVVGALVKWTGPREPPRPRPVITTAEPPAGARGATQRSPW